MFCIYLSMDPLMDHLVKKHRPYDKSGRMTNIILFWNNDITITCKWLGTGLTKPHQHKLSKLLFLLFLETVYNTRKKHRNLSRKRCHKFRGISNFKFSLKVTVYSNQKIVRIGTKVEIYRRSGLFSDNSQAMSKTKWSVRKCCPPFIALTPNLPNLTSNLNQAITTKQIHKTQMSRPPQHRRRLRSRY